MDNNPPAQSDGRRALLSGRGWDARSGQSGLVVALTGDWIMSGEHDAEDGSSIQKILDAANGRSISFASDRLGHWDSALLIFIIALEQGARQRDIAFETKGLPESATRLIALTVESNTTRVPEAAKISFVSRVGMSVLNYWSHVLAATAIIGDTILSIPAAVVGRVGMRRTDLVTCLHEAGATALPIVTVVNALIGGIVAFAGVVQLRKFGAGIFVADLTGVAMVREMTPLMTAIVMSGRTGGAYAAHIATMVGNEEIDALRAIGIPVHDYLVLPRIVALTVMMPLLYLYGCVVGIFGGFVVAVTMMNLSPQAFIEETRQSFGADQIWFGLTKSLAFGVLISIVGCRSGLNAGRGAADVGHAATSAVVTGIVGVIVLDAIFAVCANALNF
jgi:phospholipid/cholesterol/gamma-HCH transport system permease protein